MDLDKTIRELEAEAERLEEQASRYRRAVALIRGDDEEPVEAVSPAEQARRVLAAHEPASSDGEPPPRRPQSRHGSKITLEQVRDAGRTLGFFNIARLCEHLDVPLSRRSAVRNRVAELTDKGTFTRHGGEKGPTVRWEFVKPEGASPPRPRTAPPPELVVTGRRSGANVVPLTGRAKGPSGKPGRDKKVASRGHRVKRARQGS